MAPHLYYRVEDAHSRARYIDDEGIFAEDPDTTVDFTKRGTALLRRHLEQHLDWGNRNPTPFISMYSDKDVAWREARRRANTGKQDVRIYMIDTSESDEHMEYRNIRYLAKTLRLYIHDDAWNNSEYEYVFLDYVPESAIVKWWELELE